MKNLKWLVQSNGINFTQYSELFDKLKRQNYNTHDIGILSPNNITNLENILEPNDFYIIRGGTRLLTILNNIENISECNEFLSNEQINNSNYYLNELKNAIDYDFEKFDQLYYKDLNLPLLNSTAQYTHYSECKDMSFKDNMFIKPSRDLKSFNGGILESGTTIKEYILNGPYQKEYINEVIILDKVKTINTEYRFFCIKDKIITGSLYKRNNILTKSNIIPNYILSKAEEYVKLYNPADIFVMDLCELSNTEIKIVEYNCWNCSGFYDSNINKIIDSVSNFKKELNEIR
jgi:hypothetical protein